MANYTDYLVKCKNPKYFDQTVNMMGAVLQQNQDDSYVQDKDGYYNMRVLGDAGFVEFAIKNQGYGEIIKKLDTA